MVCRLRTQAKEVFTYPLWTAYAMVCKREAHYREGGGNVKAFIAFFSDVSAQLASLPLFPLFGCTPDRRGVLRVHSLHRFCCCVSTAGMQVL